MAKSYRTLILKRLEDLNIAFEDCRGQSYNNGANMRGKRKGVQARLLTINPRALFVPCAAHTLNLVVGDAARSSKEATSYLVIFTLFSSSIQRRSVLKSHVKVTLKSWSVSRWENPVNRVEAIRYQAPQVREALLEVKEMSADPALQIEAQSLAEEFGSFGFSVCTLVWYDILNRIENVSKLMQSVSIRLHMAVDLLGKTKTFLTDYRGNGFASAQALAREMCEEMNVDAVLQEKRLRSTRRQFSYSMDVQMSPSVMH